MITVDKAKLIIEKYINILDIEKIELKNSGNRVLAEDILANFPSPLFDNSAMDGFAVRSSDLSGAKHSSPIQLKLIGISSAGSPTDIIVREGQCVQCMTGAKIPAGADSIIMVENTSGFDNNVVQFFSETSIGNNIRKKGEEVEKGTTLILKGTRITPSEIGILATFGYGSVSVYKRPKIAIFGTGDELVEPGNDLDHGQIYNSNLYVFSELVKKSGSELIIKKVIKDDKDSLKTFLNTALEECNIIISSGGVSMGKHDYVRDVFIELGVKEQFWKVAQKPGKPLFFGTRNSSLIFGLPGNPVSSYIGFMIWVWPVLIQMMGESEDLSVTAILREKFPLENQKHRYLFGKAWYEENTLVCKPTTKLGSHMLLSSKNANCIIEASKGDNYLELGTRVQINLLPWKIIK